MKKDIVSPKIENVGIAIVKEKNELNEIIWNVYLINQKDNPIQNVLISSKGYMTDLKGNETKTSVLRHSLNQVEAKSFQLIEPIIEAVFALHNEYWLSFYQDKTIYDKKYIFLAETICEQNLINIPLINKPGVMIK